MTFFFAIQFLGEGRAQALCPPPWTRACQLLCKDSTFTVFIRLLKNPSKKNPVHFTRYCAFAQKCLILRVTNVKNKNLTHPKSAKLATLSLSY